MCVFFFRGAVHEAAQAGAQVRLCWDQLALVFLGDLLPGGLQTSQTIKSRYLRPLVGPSRLGGAAQSLGQPWDGGRVSGVVSTMRA